MSSNHTAKLFQSHAGLPLRLILDGIIIGVFAGAFASLYRYLLEQCNHLRLLALGHNDLLHIAIYALLLLLFAWICLKLLEWAPLSGGSGIPQVEGEVLGYFQMNSGKTLSAKIIGGSLANLSGLSLGREGPSIQIGAAVGKLSSRILKRDLSEEKYMISAGSAAGLAAAFNAPMSAVLFILEEVHKSFSPYLFVPAMIAAMIADGTAKLIFGTNPVFHFPERLGYDQRQLPYILIFGILVGLLGLLFNFGILYFQKLFKNYIPSRYLGLALTFLSSLPIAFLLPEIQGGGHGLVNRLIHHRYAIGFLALLLVAKFLFTCFSYGSGVQGGIFLPILVLGAISGLIFASLIPSMQTNFELAATQYMVLGMAAMMSAVVRSPLLAIMLVSEMTASFNIMLPLCLVVFTAYILGDRLKVDGIYESLLERMLPDEHPGVIRLLHSIDIDPYSDFAHQRLDELQLPHHCLCVSLERDGCEQTPRGSTIIRPGDHLLFLCEESAIPLLKSGSTDHSKQAPR
ncbi:MAG: ClC family H(+)/Cl(-) exchange transporter [Eubacteriales bacterium]|nr:ClC family H(+)/Cl(-) exchange transporter [Eubacteriales bacterium]